MDQITHDLRLVNWKAVMDWCQARPAGFYTYERVELNINYEIFGIMF